MRSNWASLPGATLNSPVAYTTDFLRSFSFLLGITNYRSSDMTHVAVLSLQAFVPRSSSRDIRVMSHRRSIITRRISLSYLRKTRLSWFQLIRVKSIVCVQRNILGMLILACMNYSSCEFIERKVIKIVI